MDSKCYNFEMETQDLRVHQHLIDRLILLSSVVSGVSLVPEVWRVLETHQANTMTGASLFIMLFNSLVWFIYGMHCGMRPLQISSVLTILTSGFLVISKFLY